MKIYGLLDINELRISDKKEVSFENYRIFSYRVSELGADGIVVRGSKSEEETKFFENLKRELDIPLFEVENFKDALSLDEFLKGKRGSTLIIEDSKILEHFDGRKEFIPIYTALIAYKAKKEGFETLIAKDVEAVKTSLRLE
jgi:hypothetical protein